MQRFISWSFMIFKVVRLQLLLNFKKFFNSSTMALSVLSTILDNVCTCMHRQNLQGMRELDPI